MINKKPDDDLKAFLAPKAQGCVCYEGYSGRILISCETERLIPSVDAKCQVAR